MQLSWCVLLWVYCHVSESVFVGLLPSPGHGADHIQNTSSNTCSILRARISGVGSKLAYMSQYSAFLSYARLPWCQYGDARHFIRVLERWMLDQHFTSSLSWEIRFHTYRYRKRERRSGRTSIVSSRNLATTSEDKLRPGVCYNDLLSA
jgi:hypothetical protein